MDATSSNYGYHKVDLLISITLISGIHVLAEIWLYIIWIFINRIRDIHNSN